MSTGFELIMITVVVIIIAALRVAIYVWSTPDHHQED